MLSGEFDYGQDGPLKAGMLGYYPEGVPLRSAGQHDRDQCAVLQFGGASGSAICSRARSRPAWGAEKFGSSRTACSIVTTARRARGARDAYQAIWEHVHGRRWSIRRARYDAPIMIDAANYQWAPMKGAPGVVKLFGVWTERRTEARLVKLAAGAIYAVDGRGLYLVLSGAGEADGNPLQQFTTVLVETGEAGDAAGAGEAMELLHYGLPDLSGSQLGIHRASPCRRRSECGPPNAALLAQRRDVAPGAARSRSAWRRSRRASRRPTSTAAGPDLHRGLRARRRRRYAGAPGRAPPRALHSGPAGGYRAEHGGRRGCGRGQLPRPAGCARTASRSRCPAGPGLSRASCAAAGIGLRSDWFSYIGSPGAVNSVMYVRAATGIRTLRRSQGRAAHRHLRLARRPAPRPAWCRRCWPATACPSRSMLGYVSTARVLLALEQGEIDAVFTVWDSLRAGRTRSPTGSWFRSSNPRRSCRTFRWCVTFCRRAGSAAHRGDGDRQFRPAAGRPAGIG